MFYHICREIYKDHHVKAHRKKIYLKNNYLHIFVILINKGSTWAAVSVCQISHRTLMLILTSMKQGKLCSQQVKFWRQKFAL